MQMREADPNDVIVKIRVLPRDLRMFEEWFQGEGNQAWLDYARARKQRVLRAAQFDEHDALRLKALGVRL